MERRARMIAERRDQLRGQMLKDKTPRRRQKESLSAMRRVVEGLKLMQSQQTDKVHDRLSQAGLRSRDAIIVFLFFKVAMPVLLGAAAFLLVYLLQFGDLGPATRLAVVLGGIGLGFFAPELCVSNLTKKRQLALGKGLPDGLDLLVICAESGLSLDASLERVANEIGGANAALAEELSLTSIELGFLPDRRQALTNLNRRTNLASIRGVVNTLAADREIRHALVAVAARAGQRVPRSAYAPRGREGGAPAGDADRADDLVHPAGPVHRSDRAGDHQRHGYAQQVSRNAPAVARPASAHDPLERTPLLACRAAATGRLISKIERRRSVPPGTTSVATTSGAPARRPRRPAPPTVP